jgi:prepilin-type processing-associated H-X9-DG protein
MSARMSSSGEGVAEGAADPSLPNLKSITLAIEMYMTDHDAAPPMADPERFRAVLDEYVANADAFKDPESGEYYSPNASLSGKPTSAIKDASRTVVIYQPSPGKDGRRGVGFVDGHVAKVTEEEWQKLKAASGIS